MKKKVSFKKNLDYYLNQQEKAVMEHPSIEVKLNTCVTPELAEEIHADVLIAAIGAEASRPPIEGIQGSHVLSAQDAYVHPELLGDKIVIMGAGPGRSRTGTASEGAGKRSCPGGDDGPCE